MEKMQHLMRKLVRVFCMVCGPSVQFHSVFPRLEDLGRPLKLSLIF